MKGKALEMTLKELERYWKKKSQKTITSRINTDNLPRRVRPNKRIYNKKRKCIMLAIQPMMHTAYILFSDTNEIAVAPLRLLQKDISHSKKLEQWIESLQKGNKQGVE